MDTRLYAGLVGLGIYITGWLLSSVIAGIAAHRNNPDSVQRRTEDFREALIYIFIWPISAIILLGVFASDSGFVDKLKHGIFFMVKIPFNLGVVIGDFVAKKEEI